MDEKLRTTLEVFARNDMNMSRTADELHYSIGAVLYRLRRIKELTGKNPMRFFDLCELMRERQQSDFCPSCGARTGDD